MNREAGDPFELRRFEQAQFATFDTAVAELREGAKRSHWMWFVFPQLRGLGRSPTAAHFGIASAAEARAYLAHRTLGPRLLQCVDILNRLGAVSAQQVFGAVDATKLRSCLTLFEAVADDKQAFAQALNRFFGGQRDASTLALLADPARH